MNEKQDLSSLQPSNPQAAVSAQVERIAFDGQSAKVKASIIVTLLPLFVFVLPGAFWIIKGLGVTPVSYSMLLFGVVFSSLGILFTMFAMSVAFRKKPEFDFLYGVFYPKGRGAEEISFSLVASLEIKPFLVLNQRRRKQTVYELDAVLKDGSRHRILRHPDLKRIKSDAKELAYRMSVPLELNESSHESESHQKTVPAAQKTAPASQKTKLVQCVLGIVLLGIGAIWLWLWFGRPLWLIQQSARWVDCPAVITHSELKASRGGKGGTTYRVIINYQYEIDGRKFVSDRYDFFMSNLSSNLGYEKKRQAVDEMTVGKQVTCLVNPEDHSDAVICRDVFYSHYVFVIFPLIPLVAGFFFLKSGVFCLLRTG